MYVRVWSIDGRVLRSWGPISNRDPRNVFYSAEQDVSDFAGQQVRIGFEVAADPSDPTFFYVDDVSLVACTADSTSPTPTQTSPTPTPIGTRIPRVRFYLPSLARDTMATPTSTPTPTSIPTPTATRTPSPTPVPGQPGQAVSGHWTGTTNAGRAMSFDVNPGGSSVSQFTLSVAFAVGGCRGTEETTDGGRLAVSDGRFSRNSGAMQYSGRFTSSRTAEGTYTYTTQPSFGCDSTFHSGTWSASVP
jgi:hypothetical protein